MNENDERLTKPDPILADRMRLTPDGMAFWATTGPHGTSCRECLHWDHTGYYSAQVGFRGGEARPARCKKYRAMMNGKWGGLIPNTTPSCKYFDHNPKAPKRYR
jgi:hypothetical protein